jgi:hypothetical protein
MLRVQTAMLKYDKKNATDITSFDPNLPRAFSFVQFATRQPGHFSDPSARRFFAFFSFLVSKETQCLPPAKLPK